MPDKQKVLFVCIHNSARSQMAEAFLNDLGRDRFEAKSGGLEAGVLNPLVVDVMRETGVDISAQRAKRASDFLETGEQFAYVITVCDETSAEQCPIFPGGTKRLHWSFPDPSRVQGTDAEKLAAIRQIRDAIKARVEEFCANQNP